jgi:hypothetical protein
VDNTVVWEDLEGKLTGMLTAELAAQIDRDIINMLRRTN